MKNYLLLITVLIGINSCSFQNNDMENKKNISQQYFKAFHEGKLDEVFSYLSENATVQYGAEEPVDAKIFFPQSADLIASLMFKTHAIYTSENTNNIIIHFSFYPKSDKNSVTEAIDIIEFDNSNKIAKVKVIPNSKNN